MKLSGKIRLLILILFLIPATALFAEDVAAENLTEAMTMLVLQLGIVIFAVKGGGAIAKKIHMPIVLGELLTGVIIGPYALGALPFPGLPHGFFPSGAGELAIDPILYGFSTIGSIILLFASGLETDLDMFIRYSVRGSIVGLGGFIISFFFGAAAAAVALHTGLESPAALFLGIMCTATSVGITARILSDRKKMDSPEGVTILAAAVFDDVLGIIGLAIVLGIVSAMTGTAEGGLQALGVVMIALKAFGLWLGFTIFGLIFGKKIAVLLKKSGNASSFTMLALGLALLLAGFFETQGLAMIIGAYIAGLALSKTDLSYIIQEKMHPLYEFFVPIFFAVMGMLVDIRQIATPEVLSFGLIFTLLAIVSKILGCAVPSLFLGFNLRGSLRIGLGMVPRGEVALIIAGIGLSTGILSQSIFGVAILMTMVTTLAAPPLLSSALKHGGSGTRNPVKGADTELITLEFPSREIADLITDTLLRTFSREGFLVQLMNIQQGISYIRKDEISIALREEETTLTLETAPDDVNFTRTAVYETIMDLNASFDKLSASYDPAKLRKELTPEMGGRTSSFLRHIDKRCLTAQLQSNKKEDAIRELVELIAATGNLKDKDLALKDILAREQQMSTGMQFGIAMPHARTLGTDTSLIAIGISSSGVDFTTFDNTTVTIVALIISPAQENGPHMQTLAGLGAVLGNESARKALMAAKTPDEVYEALANR